MPHINLEEVDVDGAVREAAEEVSGGTRLSFLRKAGVAGVTAASGGAIPSALAPAAMASSGRPPAKFGKAPAHSSGVRRPPTSGARPLLRRPAPARSSAVRRPQAGVRA